jgi:excinuclease ABC subunit B
MTTYLLNLGIRSKYIHSDVDTLERVEIMRDLRMGVFYVLVGVNLLREGLDLPEVSLVAILDADKEGFLRSTTSLVQTAGRCARHVKGRVILYADHETDAIRETIEITRYHREKQIAYNTAHHITPKSVKRKINESVYVYTAGKGAGGRKGVVPVLSGGGVDQAVLDDLRREMMEAADALEFERAAYLRDQIKSLERKAKA